MFEDGLEGGVRTEYVLSQSLRQGEELCFLLGQISLQSEGENYTHILYNLPKRKMLCRFDPLPSLSEESNWDRIELEVLDPTHVDVVLQSGGHHQVQQYLGFLRALSLGGLNSSYLSNFKISN